MRRKWGRMRAKCLWTFGSRGKSTWMSPSEILTLAIHHHPFVVFPDAHHLIPSLRLSLPSFYERSVLHQEHKYLVRKELQRLVLGEKSVKGVRKHWILRHDWRHFVPEAKVRRHSYTLLHSTSCCSRQKRSIIVVHSRFPLRHNTQDRPRKRPGMTIEFALLCLSLPFSFTCLKCSRPISFSVVYFSQEKRKRRRDRDRKEDMEAVQLRLCSEKRIQSPVDTYLSLCDKKRHACLVFREISSVKVCILSKNIFRFTERCPFSGRGSTICEWKGEKVITRILWFDRHDHLSQVIEASNTFGWCNCNEREFRCQFSCWCIKTREWMSCIRNIQGSMRVLLFSSSL